MLIHRMVANRSLNFFVAVALLSTVSCATPTPISTTSQKTSPLASTSTKPADNPLPTATTCVSGYADPVIVIDLASGSMPSDFAAADFNGDNLADVIITRGSINSDESHEQFFLANDGHGKLSNETETTFKGPITKSQTPREVIIADFNGDGIMDIFVADSGNEIEGPPYSGFQNALTLSAVDGKLVDGTPNLPQQSAFTHSAAAADIDSDGDMDLFIGNWDVIEKPGYILLNDGQAKFAVAPGSLAQVGPIINSSASSLFADLDNDGFPDLVIGTTESSTIIPVLLNNGNGVFTPLHGSIPAYPFPFTENTSRDYVADIAAGDLNGDGYLDLVLSWTKNIEPNGRYLQVLINQGDATFTDESAVRIPSQVDMESINNWFKFIELTDADHDDDLDLLTHPHGHSNTVIYENIGDGVFEPSTSMLPIPEYGWYGLADFNGDGYKDIITFVSSTVEGFSVAFGVGLWNPCP